MCSDYPHACPPQDCIHGWAILRWAILSTWVIRIAHLNYDGFICVMYAWYGSRVIARNVGCVFHHNKNNLLVKFFFWQVLVNFGLKSCAESTHGIKRWDSTAIWWFIFQCSHALINISGCSSLHKFHDHKWQENVSRERLGEKDYAPTLPASMALTTRPLSRLQRCEIQLLFDGLFSNVLMHW